MSLNAVDADNISLDEFNEIMKSIRRRPNFTSIDKEPKTRKVIIYEVERGDNDIPADSFFSFIAMIDADTGELLNLLGKDNRHYDKRFIYLQYYSTNKFIR